MYQVDRVQPQIRVDLVDEDVLFDRKVKLECVLTCCCWQVTLDMTWHGTVQVSIVLDMATYVNSVICLLDVYQMSVLCLLHVY